MYLGLIIGSQENYSVSLKRGSFISNKYRIHSAHAPITAHQRHFQFKISGTIKRPLK